MYKHAICHNIVSTETETD